MEDTELIARIGALVEEEHQLERELAVAPAEDESPARLQEIELALDQCWDLLRQRRARRSAGEDPDGASVRPADVVEHYRQ